MSFLSAIGNALTTAVSGTPVGMAISGGLGLLGSAMDNHANKNIAKMNYDAQMRTNQINAENVAATNQANLDIARMNNQYNRENLQMQNDFNRDMWHEANAYNDPSQQVQRLISAGINPYNAGLDGSGQASTIQSAAANPASDVGRQESFQAAAPSFDYSADTYRQAFNNMLVSSQARSTNYDVQERQVTLAQRMAEAQSRIENANVDKDTKVLQKSILDQTKQYLVESAQLNAEDMRNNILFTQAKRDEVLAHKAYMEADSKFKQAELFLKSRGLDIQEKGIANQMRAAILNYQAQLNAAAKSLEGVKYASDTQAKIAQARLGHDRKVARNNLIRDMEKLNIDKKNVEIMEDRLNWETSDTKYLQDLTKGLLAPVIGAAGFMLGKGI